MKHLIKLVILVSFLIVIFFTVTQVSYNKTTGDNTTSAKNTFYEIFVITNNSHYDGSCYAIRQSDNAVFPLTSTGFYYYTVDIGLTTGVYDIRICKGGIQNEYGSTTAEITSSNTRPEVEVKLSGGECPYAD